MPNPLLPCGGFRSRSQPVATTLLLSLLLFAVALPAVADAPESPGFGNSKKLELADASTLKLDGDSPLRRFSAAAKGLHASFVLGPPSVVVEAGSGVEALIRGGVIRGIELTIPVAQLTSGNDQLDGNLRRGLHASTEKEIVFRVVSYEMSEPTPPGAPFAFVLHGPLSIGGVERQVDVVVQGTALGDMVRLTGSKDLLMSDYNLARPSLLFGLLRPKDLIAVTFDLIIQKTP